MTRRPTPKAKPAAYDFIGARAFITHATDDGHHTLYGPFATRAEAVRTAAVTFADEDFLELHIGYIRPRTINHKCKPSPWSIQSYDANELNWLNTSPEEMGYRSFTMLSADKLPLTGSWPASFSHYSPYTADTAKALLSAMSEDAGEYGNAPSDWLMDAAFSAGLLSAPQAVQ